MKTEAAKYFLPKIVVKKNVKYEIGLFCNFLVGRRFPQLKHGILKTHTELELLPHEKNTREKGVAKFINSFYKKNRKEIEEIVANSKSAIRENGGEILGALSRLMDYKWKNGVVYTAIATILPFSPLNEPIFNFSILRQLNEKKLNKTILNIATHEISHFIFYDVLKRAERKAGFKIGDDARHYLKEAFAPTIMNQALLQDLLKLENYRGNPELWHLRIDDGGQVTNFVEYLTSAYNESRAQNKKFNTFLFELITRLRGTLKTFTQKRALWNKYGNNIQNNTKALTRYQTPLKIKRAAIL